MYEYRIAPIGAHKSLNKKTSWPRVRKVPWFWASLLLGLFLVAYIVKQANDLASSVPHGLSTLAATILPPPARIELDGPTIIRAVQAKFEVTTVSRTDTKPIPTGNYSDNDWFWQRMVEYERTHNVTMKVNAGFDFGNFNPSQITATHDTITVNLGSPKILGVVPVYAGITLVGERGNPLMRDPELDLQMLAKADEVFRTESCKSGIMKEAADSAEKQVGTFLQTFLRAAGDKRAIVVTSNSPTC